MADDPIVQMAGDPDFGKLPLQEQRKALAAHDASFGKVGDADITRFVKTHQVAAAAPIPPSTTPFPGAPQGAAGLPGQEPPSIAGLTTPSPYGAAKGGGFLKSNAPEVGTFGEYNEAASIPFNAVMTGGALSGGVRALPAIGRGLATSAVTGPGGAYVGEKIGGIFGPKGREYGGAIGGTLGTIGGMYAGAKGVKIPTSRAAILEALMGAGEKSAVPSAAAAAPEEAAGADIISRGRKIVIPGSDIQATPQNIKIANDYTQVPAPKLNVLLKNDDPFARLEIARRKALGMWGARP